MMLRLSLLASLAAVRAADIPDAFLGTWSLINNETALGPIGPSGILKHFRMSKDTKNGGHWFSAINGQVFRVKDNLMQYCFRELATSPFVVDSVTDTKLVFCYKTGHRMLTHKENATGCDAAVIQIELLSSGNLEFSFFMSPPIRHAWGIFRRTGLAPPVAWYILTNVGNCDPMKPGPPTLLGTAGSPSMCPVVAQKKPHAKQFPATAPTGIKCRQMDSGAWFEGQFERPDIRFEYDVPKAPCWPCKVSYSVSAAVEEHQYIAIGFKGMAYRYYTALFRDFRERPSYFGMSTDAQDEETTGSVIALGYAQSGFGCLREMKSDSYSGPVSDVYGNPNLYNTSIERTNGRTVMRFMVEQRAGNTTEEIASFFGDTLKSAVGQHSQRVMWAIGEIKASTGEACDAKVMHHEARGVSPLGWFHQNPYCSRVADVPEVRSAELMI